MSPEHTRDDEPTIDRTVRPGDVALDTAQGTWVHVEALAAPDVATWNRENDDNLLEYTGNWLTGATLGDRVFSCTYLGGSGVKSGPSGSYDFPESRLARWPGEEANADLVRPQVDILGAFLERFFYHIKVEGYDVDAGERTDLFPSVRDAASTTLQYSPLDFDEDVVAKTIDRADDASEQRFKDDLERWENAQDDVDDAVDTGDADPETETIEADLGTEDVDDVDDSDLDAETVDEDDQDAEESGDDDGLGDFEDYDPEDDTDA